MVKETKIFNGHRYIRFNSEPDTKKIIKDAAKYMGRPGKKHRYWARCVPVKESDFEGDFMGKYMLYVRERH